MCEKYLYGSEGGAGHDRPYPYPRHQKKVPFRKGADRGVNHKLCFVMCFETCRVVDHPVCGDAVASRLFIDAAHSPPLRGGECAHTKRFANSITRSQPWANVYAASRL